MISHYIKQIILTKIKSKTVSFTEKYVFRKLLVYAELKFPPEIEY